MKLIERIKEYVYDHTTQVLLLIAVLVAIGFKYSHLIKPQNRQLPILMAPNSQPNYNNSGD